MIKAITSLPWWAFTNTVLIFGPTALGIGFFNVWFVPNERLLLPAIGCVFAYYTLVFWICTRTSGAKPDCSAWSQPPVWRSRTLLLLGVLQFTLLAIAAFYAVIPGLITGMIGPEVRKEYRVVDFQRRAAPDTTFLSCRNWIDLEVTPTSSSSRFCVQRSDIPPTLTRGSAIALYGRESVLGFSFNRIGH